MFSPTILAPVACDLLQRFRCHIGLHQWREIDLPQPQVPPKGVAVYLQWPRPLLVCRCCYASKDG